MRFDVITLFPQMLQSLAQCGITSRAHTAGLWELLTWNPRDFTLDAHRTVDDRPFGGGPGMVMMAEPLALAVEAASSACRVATGGPARVVALSPSGQRLTDARVRAMAQAETGLVLVCGRYEGIDQRFLDEYVDEEVSIGDFVMSGGEIGALALIDAVVRQLPGALKLASVAQESFIDGLLDAPQYTRPENWRGLAVPPVLRSGNHAAIDAWRRQQRLRVTAQRRPDLIEARRRDAHRATDDRAPLTQGSHEACGREGKAVE